MEDRAEAAEKKVEEVLVEEVMAVAVRAKEAVEREAEEKALAAMARGMGMAVEAADD